MSSFFSSPISIARLMSPPASDPDDPDRRKRLKMAAGDVSPDEPYTPVARASVQPSLNQINERSGPAGTELFRASLAHLSPTLPQYPMPSVPDAGPAPSPVASTDRQRVDTSQPNPMSATANYVGARPRVASPDNLYSTIQPGPAQREFERVQAAGAQPAHGWGRVGHVALELLRGNPAGAAVEGLAPGYAAKQRFQRHDLPLAQHNAEVEQGMASHRIGDIARIANETGTLPSGQMTEPARVRVQRQHEIETQHDITNALRDQQLTIAQQRANTGDTRADAYVDNLSDMQRHRGVTEKQTDKRIAQGDTKIKQADRAQSYREWLGKQQLSRADQRIAIYDRISRQKGEESPEAEAFRTLHEQGKIDANGMADNPKYLADVERRMAGARWFHTDTSGNVDEEAARKDAEASAAIEFKPKVAVTELEDFKGLKLSYKVRGKTGQPNPNRSSQRQSAVDEYNRRKAAKPEKAEAMREAFKQQMGFDPEQP